MNYIFSTYGSLMAPVGLTSPFSIQVFFTHTDTLTVKSQDFTQHQIVFPHIPQSSQYFIDLHDKKLSTTMDNAWAIESLHKHNKNFVSNILNSSAYSCCSSVQANCQSLLLMNVLLWLKRATAHREKPRLSRLPSTPFYRVTKQSISKC